MSKVRITEIIAPHFVSTFNSFKTNQIDKGGRGSAKTSKNAIKTSLLCQSNKECSAVCIRRYQKTLRDSVYKEIKRAMKRLGLQELKHYSASLTPLGIHLNNDNNIYFAGGDDYEKIKGMIDENTPIKVVWFSEITEFDSPDEIDQIIATFSRGNDDWFIVLYEYNPPKNKFHWVNQWEEKMKKRSDTIVTQSDYRTVPKEWLGKKFIEQAETMQKYDEKRYRWIYLGEVVGLDGLIHNPDLIEWVSEDYLEKNNIRILYVDFSIDSGHQTSATTRGAYGYGSDGYWYRLDCYYYSPNEKPIKKAPSELSRDLYNFKKFICNKYKCPTDNETIDSAEGALRNQYFKDYGEALHPVNKGTDKESLTEYANDFLALGKFRVLNNNNNQIFKKEIENYLWKEGSVESGKPIPDKTEKEFSSDEQYFNTHSNSYSYSYADHTCDEFQYWVKDNLQKLGLEF